MSLALFPVDVTKVLIPRAKLNEKKEWAVLKGSAETTWRPVQTTSYSNSSIQFSAPPPSPYIIVDRKVYLNVVFNINFTATARAGLPIIDMPDQMVENSEFSTIC